MNLDQPSTPLCLACVISHDGDPNFDWHPLATGEECGADTCSHVEGMRFFYVSWDTHAETHTIASLREKFGKTNLFDDGVWSTMSTWSTSLENLAQVLKHIQTGEEWTCDNCTVSLAEVITHDEQEMSQPENVLADHDWDGGA